MAPAPRQHLSKGEKELAGEGAMPADWTPAKRRQKDTDATWTKKHGQSHFGYKLSVNVDRKYKVIRKIKTGTARSHDSRHFDAVLDPGNTSRDVHADRGYSSEAREEQLKEAGDRNQIQRKGVRNKPLSACQKRRNQRIAKIRARIEHVFAAIEQMKGQAHSHDWASPGQLRHDDDGDLLQHEALGLLHEGGSPSLLTPVMGRIALTQGDMAAKTGRDAPDRVVC